jgi:hypothetical protein
MAGGICKMNKENEESFKDLSSAQEDFVLEQAREYHFDKMLFKYKNGQIKSFNAKITVRV